MKELYNDFGFVLIFLIIVYLFENAFGDETTQKILGVVLLGMLIFNAKKLKNVTKIVNNAMQKASKGGGEDEQ
uniref:Uncharacterized protein n=1 Tax=Tectiviridae sp. cthzn51 TaxID=2826821 RepID=A0A8S5LUG3_9VIRU|nr:MAG TPA: hypothetical protein [Tectiviridae sp. cthzn51]